MKPTVLVTGIGGVIGYGILRSLQHAQLPVELWAADADPGAVGFAFTPQRLVIPRADSPEYTQFLLDFGRDKGPVMILPGIEQDLERMMRDREILTGAGLLPALPTEDTFKITDDKYNTFQFYSRVGLPMIPSALLSEPLDVLKALGGFPMILKPRSSCGGKGMKEVEDQAALEFWRQRLPQDEYLAQPRVGSDEDEFTCGIYRTRAGRLLGPILLRRKLGYGSTIRATSEQHEKLADFVRELVTHLEGGGPFCCQLRWSGGQPWLLEINSRLSSSTSIKARLGFNEPAMLVQEYLLGQEPDPPKIVLGRTVTRYLEDWLS